MKLLLVDNSNTRTKFSLATPDKLESWHTIIPTVEITDVTLSTALKDINWDQSIVSSVVPTKASILKNWLKKKPCHLLSYKSNLPIHICYPQPQQIGADRLANSAAAYSLYGSHCIIIDFGTAVTFDIIAPEKQALTNSPVAYLGGVIAPGLASMTEGLARRTALLPHIQLEEPKHAIGKSTEEAMLSGAVYGYRGLVKEIIHNLRNEIPPDPIIIATGGDAELIAQGVPEIHHVVPQLTMEGLRISAILNTSA